MIILAFDMITNSSYKIFYYNQSQLSSLNQSSVIMRDFERTTRGASNFRGIAFIANTADTLTFYAYQKNDAYTAPSKISYYFNGNTLKKSIIAPVANGDTYDYPPADAKVTDFAGTITNHNIFTYFDENYKGTGSPLAQPVQSGIIRVVKIDVTVTGKVPASETTAVQLRNLKLNL